ncbi:hypothetical protein HELRODRAFT_179665 [Helobdella robusta]|uniref:Uncharacterized protein n=1 Tax=Helobdella robusta TaxID=6412 RepID=T1FF02_HELRO|nr:hypothetical protein HELRODRAFT_179665 [Helobdella robusta]ESN95081.1 hypothetical protein HELRODRAFT_179665 [Helobdella robusta]
MSSKTINERDNDDVVQEKIFLHDNVFCFYSSALYGDNQTSSSNNILNSNDNIKNFFKCSSTNRCINMSLVCDGVEHCGDGSDESLVHARCYDFYKLHSESSWYVELLMVVLGCFVVVAVVCCVVGTCLECCFHVYRYWCPKKLQSCLQRRKTSPVNNNTNNNINNINRNTNQAVYLSNCPSVHSNNNNNNINYNNNIINNNNNFSQANGFFIRANESVPNYVANNNNNINNNNNNNYDNNNSNNNRDSDCDNLKFCSTTNETSSSSLIFFSSSLSREEHERGGRVERTIIRASFEGHFFEFFLISSSPSSSCSSSVQPEHQQHLFVLQHQTQQQQHQQQLQKNRTKQQQLQQQQHGYCSFPTYLWKSSLETDKNQLQHHLHHQQHQRQHQQQHQRTWSTKPVYDVYSDVNMQKWTAVVKRSSIIMTLHTSNPCLAAAYSNLNLQGHYIQQHQQHQQHQQQRQKQHYKRNQQQMLKSFTKIIHKKSSLRSEVSMKQHENIDINNNSNNNNTNNINNNNINNNNINNNKRPCTEKRLSEQFTCLSQEVQQKFRVQIGSKFSCLKFKKITRDVIRVVQGPLDTVNKESLCYDENMKDLPFLWIGLYSFVLDGMHAFMT